MMTLDELRMVQRLGEELVRAAKEMEASGLVDGTAGNLSCIAPSGEYVLITPTGVPYSELEAGQLPIVDLDGILLSGTFLPSSEVQMHLGVYRARPDVSSVVHTHSRFATTYAVLNRPLLAVHYVLAFAGPGVAVAPYQTYGTYELGESCVAALGDRNAVLLQNHGVLAVARSPRAALNVAQVVEYTAELQWRAECIGTPTVLDEPEMERVAVKFKSYGQPQRVDHDPAGL